MEYLSIGVFVCMQACASVCVKLTTVCIPTLVVMSSQLGKQIPNCPSGVEIIREFATILLVNKQAEMLLKCYSKYAYSYIYPFLYCYMFTVELYILQSLRQSFYGLKCKKVFCMK